MQLQDAFVGLLGVTAMAYLQTCGDDACYIMILQLPPIVATPPYPGWESSRLSCHVGSFQPLPVVVSVVSTARHPDPDLAREVINKNSNEPLNLQHFIHTKTFSPNFLNFNFNFKSSLTCYITLLLLEEQQTKKNAQFLLLQFAPDSQCVASTLNVFLFIFLFQSLPAQIRNQNVNTCLCLAGLESNLVHSQP